MVWLRLFSSTTRPGHNVLISVVLSSSASARDFSHLTQLGLVRVTIALPANVKLLDCGASVPCPASAAPTAETSADVWRSVPSVLDTRITGPDGLGPVWARGLNPSGGYQLDARIDTLQSSAGRVGKRCSIERARLGFEASRSVSPVMSARRRVRPNAAKPMPSKASKASKASVAGSGPAVAAAAVVTVSKEKLEGTVSRRHRRQRRGDAGLPTAR